MIKKLLLLVQFLIISNINSIAIAIDLKNLDEQISYSLGFMAAEHAKSKSSLGIKVNPDSFIKGFKDNFNNKQQLDQEQIIKSLNIIREKQLELQKKYMDKISNSAPVVEPIIPATTPSALGTTASTPTAPSKPGIPTIPATAIPQTTQNPATPSNNDINNFQDNNLLINTVQDINPKEISKNKFKDQNIEKNKSKDLTKNEAPKEIKPAIINNPNKTLTNNNTTITTPAKSVKNIASNEIVISEELAKPKEFLKKIVKELDNKKSNQESEKVKDKKKEKEISIKTIEPKIPDSNKHEKNIAKTTQQIATNTITNITINSEIKPAETNATTKHTTKPDIKLEAKSTINTMAKHDIKPTTKPEITIPTEAKTPDLNKPKLPEKPILSAPKSTNKQTDNKIQEAHPASNELAKLQELLQQQGSKKETSKEAKKTQDKISNEINVVKNFLQINKKNKGINELKSGLQYQVLNAGNQSAKSPLMHDKVKVHYRGTLVNGKEFDNSYNKNPAVFELKSVIKGWQEALTLMKPNAKWKIFVPPQLAYGNKEIGAIPANSILIFEVELIEVNPS